MKIRWSFLLSMAMLAVGYVIGRQAGVDSARSERVSRASAGEPVVRESGSDPAPSQSDVPTKDRAAAPPPGPPRDIAPRPPEQLPERAIPLPAEWDQEQFVHWYRSHAASYKFVRRSPEMLRSFAAEVIEKLGCIPRREILDALMVNYAELHEATRKVEADVGAGRISHREMEGRLAPARRLYSDRIYEALAYSDYLYLTREWADDKNPYRHFRHERAPGTPRPPVGDPFAIPLGPVEEFVAWYFAYRHDLKLPVRDHDFLSAFFNEIVEPLGRAPRPGLMRKLQALYARYLAAVDDGDSDGAATRVLFAGLRSVLEPLDYDRIRWGCDWPERLEDLGLLE